MVRRLFRNGRWIDDSERRPRHHRCLGAPRADYPCASEEARRLAVIKPNSDVIRTPTYGSRRGASSVAAHNRTLRNSSLRRQYRRSGCDVCPGKESVTSRLLKQRSPSQTGRALSHAEHYNDVCDRQSSVGIRARCCLTRRALGLPTRSRPRPVAHQLTSGRALVLRNRMTVRRRQSRGATRRRRRR